MLPVPLIIIISLVSIFIVYVIVEACISIIKNINQKNRSAHPPLSSFIEKPIHHESL
jgi:hypothetical protein